MLLRRLFTRKWILTTILAAAAALVMVNLGFWQLDRLAQRREINARILAQADADLLFLDPANEDIGSLDLHNMEYREVEVRGVYDHSQQVALRNQVFNNQIGVHLLTPLLIEGTELAILVNRGWIPAEDADRAAWEKYDQAGEVSIRGILRRSQILPEYNMKADPTLRPEQAGLDTWSQVNIERIDQQVSYALLPAYVHQFPDQGDFSLPARTMPDLALTEGPHLSYAIQWFGFAAALLIGYPFYARSQAMKAEEEEMEVNG